MIPNSKTFILTIPRNSERFNATMAHLKEQGVEPTVFAGLDGDVSGLMTRWPLRFFVPAEEPELQRWVSLYLSHYALWQMCSYQYYDWFVILEDDVRFLPGWREALAAALPLIPSDCDLFYPGSCCIADKLTEQISERLWRISGAFCTHAYAIRAKALPVLLEKLQRVDTKVDIAMAVDAMPNLVCCAMYPRICDQEGTPLSP